MLTLLLLLFQVISYSATVSSSTKQDSGIVFQVQVKRNNVDYPKTGSFYSFTAADSNDLNNQVQQLLAKLYAADNTDVSKISTITYTPTVVVTPTQGELDLKAFLLDLNTLLGYKNFITLGWMTDQDTLYTDLLSKLAKEVKPEYAVYTVGIRLQ